jgi:hypothetical protein
MERKTVHLKLTVATLSTLGTCYLLTYCRSSADSTKLKCYDFRDSQSTVSVLSQINLVRIFHTIPLTSILILSFDLRLRLQSALLSSGFVAEEN